MPRSLLERIEAMLALGPDVTPAPDISISEWATQILRKLDRGEYHLLNRETLGPLRDELHRTRLLEQQFLGGPMAGRLINTHQVGDATAADLNHQLMIEATDEPGPGGANHTYCISWRDYNGNLHAQGITFQKGGVQEKRNDLDGAPVNGVNGVSREALLAVVLDGLVSFQRGPFACDENLRAMQHIQAALSVLGERTMDCQARGVEGKEKA